MGVRQGCDERDRRIGNPALLRFALLKAYILRVYNNLGFLVRHWQSPERERGKRLELYFH